MVGVLAAGVCVVDRYVVPAYVASKLRSQLDAHGFAGSQFHVADVGLHRLHLTGVRLGDGLVLGDIELDAGLSMIWGDRPTVVTIRDARFSQHGVETLSRRPHTAVTLPFERVRLEHCELELGGVPIAVSGTISLHPGKPPGVELVARAASVHVGALTISDLVAHAHDVDGRIQACATATIAGTTAEACSKLPDVPLAGVRELELTWLLRGPGATPSWTGAGRGRVAWTDGTLRLANGHAELVMPSRSVTITAALAGSLADLALEVAGDAKTDQLELGGSTTSLKLREVRAPFSIATVIRDGKLQLTLRTALVATAADAVLHVAGTSIAAMRPAFAIRDAGIVDVATIALPVALHWRASEARLGELRFVDPSGTIDLADPRADQTAAWRAVTGPARIQLGGGELGFHGEEGSVRIRGHVHAFGGEVTLAPFVARRAQAVELVVHARGLELAHLLASAGRSEIGAGTVDADLALRVASRGDVQVTGEVRSAHLELRDRTSAMKLEGVRVPVSVRANLAHGMHLAIEAASVASAATATITHGRDSIVVRDPSLTLPAFPARTMRWEATQLGLGAAHVDSLAGTIALVPGGEQTIAWGALTRGALHAGRGELGFRVDVGQLRVDRGQLQVLGGELTVEPFVARTDHATDVVLHARGVQLARVLAIVPGDHVTGTGLLDGELAARLDSNNSSLTGGTLKARGRGEISITDPAWRARAAVPLVGIALSQRVLGALADFEYSELTAVFGPSGSGPEIRVSTRGRGKHLSQELDLVLNLNGVRDVVQRIATRVDR